MTIKRHHFDRLINKFDFRTRESRDLLAWLEVEVDGKVKRVVRTKRSKGSGDLPMQHSIRQQLHLNKEQLRTAISCKLTKAEYINILRVKGIL